MATSSITSAYMRVSVEYQIANGDNAKSRSALHATTSRRGSSARPSLMRRASSRRPAKKTGTNVSVPMQPDSARTEALPVPKTRIQPCRSR